MDIVHRNKFLNCTVTDFNFYSLWLAFVGRRRTVLTGHMRYSVYRCVCVCVCGCITLSCDEIRKGTYKHLELIRVTGSDPERGSCVICMTTVEEQPRPTQRSVCHKPTNSRRGQRS